MHFETLHKYRERITHDHRERIALAALRQASQEELEAFEVAFTRQMNLLDLAYTYRIDVTAMRNQVGPKFHPPIPKDYLLWIEFSEPFLCPLKWRHSDRQMTTVSALWFSVSETRDTCWQLELISEAGTSVDQFSYYVMSRKW